LLLSGGSQYDADYVNWYGNCLAPLLSSGDAGIFDIATRLWAGRSWVLIPIGERALYLLQIAQTGSVSTQPPVQWIPEYFLEGKAAGV
jgi:hypothetical protein